MKARPHFLPPRQSVIYAYTRRMIDESAMKAETFAMHLADQYLAIVADDVRGVPLKLGDADALGKAKKHNGQIVRRYMDGTVKVMPADLEDAWMLALPEPYRSECERDLAHRRGRMTFEVPCLGAPGADAIAPVLTESGELFVKWGGAMADNTLTALEFVEVDKEIDDVIAALLRLKQYARERAVGVINA